MASTCENCSGTGSTISREAACGTCRGQGVVRERHQVEVEIPAGVEDGMRLRIHGEGDAPAVAEMLGPDSKMPKMARGDCFVHIRVQPHSAFTRKGADVYYTASIPLTTAILGGTVKIPTLDGEVEVKVPTGTGTGDRITMSGMGMRSIGSRNARTGDLRVEFKVGMPKSLTSSQRILVELLADEMRDRTARRVMNVGFTEQQQADMHKADASEADKKDGGFLKKLFDKITHLHLGSSAGESQSGQSEDDDKKKASGSG